MATEVLTSSGRERLAEVSRYRGLTRAGAIAARRREIEHLHEALDDLVRRLGAADRSHFA